MTCSRQPAGGDINGGSRPLGWRAVTAPAGSSQGHALPSGPPTTRNMGVEVVPHVEHFFCRGASAAASAPAPLAGLPLPPPTVTVHDAPPAASPSKKLRCGCLAFLLWCSLWRRGGDER